MPRHRFNRNDEFTVAARTLTVRGVAFAQGQRFDKSLVSNKKLRRLWAQRTIVSLPAGTAPASPDAAFEPLPEVSSDADANAEKTSDPAIPDGWRSLLAEPTKDLAARFRDTKPDTKAEAVAVIEAELARRGEAG